MILIALLVPLLNAVPTLDGYMREAPPDRVFLGFRFMAGDHYQYASFIRQGAEGRFFMEDEFTTEPQRGRFVLLFFWLAGVVSRLTGLGPPGAWEILRVASGFALLMAVWAFTGLCFRERRERLLAYALVALSGGVGWAVAPLQSLIPTGTGFPGMKDAFNFQWNWSTFAAMLMPLWVAPAAAFVAAAALAARPAPASPAARWALGLVLPPAVWFMHPYTGMAAYLAFGLFPIVPAAGALWRMERVPWARVRGAFGAVAPSLASFVLVGAYLVWARQDDVFALTSRQGFVWSPAYSVFLYPFTYGLLLPLALFGMKGAAAIPERARWMLAAWLAAAAALAANPFFAGVKFQYLVHAPLALFAAHGILDLKRRSAGARALSGGLGAAVFGAALFLNAPITLLKDLPKTAADNDIYLPRSEIDAMKFLGSRPRGAVLCSDRSGNRIPWLAGKPVYLGHWFMTIDNYTKSGEVSAFFGRGASAEQKRVFLAQAGVRYVYYGAFERRLGGVDPALGLETIYDKDGVAIYRVP